MKYSLLERKTASINSAKKGEEVEKVEEGGMLELEFAILTRINSALIHILPMNIDRKQSLNEEEKKKEQEEVEEENGKRKEEIPRHSH